MAELRHLEEAREDAPAIEIFGDAHLPAVRERNERLGIGRRTFTHRPLARHTVQGEVLAHELVRVHLRDDGIVLAMHREQRQPHAPARRPSARFGGDLHDVAAGTLQHRLRRRRRIGRGAARQPRMHEDAGEHVGMAHAECRGERASRGKAGGEDAPRVHAIAALHRLHLRRGSSTSQPWRSASATMRLIAANCSGVCLHPCRRTTSG